MEEMKDFDVENQAMYSRRESKESSRKANDSLEGLLRNMGAADPYRSEKVYWPTEPTFVGWPLQMPSPNPGTFKCDKCPREKRVLQEFYSHVNCRRHMKAHRKMPDTDDLSRNRDALAEFWNQLSPEQASKILTLTDSTIDVLSGSDTAKALTNLVHQLTLSFHSQTYFRAAVSLDNIQKMVRKGNRISADDLFKTLDDASERTFLTGGTSPGVVRYINEIAKLLAEEKSSAALAAFLVEDNLVKAWNADKDEKALLVHKALVEEEEAAQKKREKIMEKKRLKKLRQKEKKGNISAVSTVDDVVEEVEVEVEVQVNLVTVETATTTAEAAGAAERADATEAAPTASSEGSDHVDADMPEARLLWGDEPPDFIKPIEAPARTSNKKPFSAVNGVKDQTFSKRQRPNFQKTSKTSNSATNGYSYWARKGKPSVRDAATDANQSEGMADGCQDESMERPSEYLQETTVDEPLKEKANDLDDMKEVEDLTAGLEEQQKNPTVISETDILMEEQPDTTVRETLNTEEQPDATVNPKAPVSESVPVISFEDQLNLTDHAGTEPEGLLIGSLNIPWRVTAVEQRRAPNVVVMAENESTSPEGQEEYVEKQVETQILLNSAELEFAWEMKCRRFLSQRWDDAVADPEAVFAATERDGSESQEGGGETPPEPGGVADVETVGSKEATPNGNVGAETDEKRMEVKNGGYRKGSRWHKASKEKAFEQRYLPKKQAPS